MVLWADLVLFALAYLGAYLLRFEFQLSSKEITNLWGGLPYILPFKGAVFFWFGAYRGMWRYTGLIDMWNLFKASVFSSLVIVTTVLFIHRFAGFSRGVFVIDGILTFMFTGGLRVFVRYLYHRNLGTYSRNEVSSTKPDLGKKGVPILIIGAGNAGEKTLRELGDNPRLPYRVKGLIDDDGRKKGRSIHGVPVLGGIESLAEIVKVKGVEEVLIATPSATGPQMRRIVEACDACGVRFKTLPGMGEIIDGKVSIKDLRDVNFKDLLGRPPVSLDLQEIESYLKGKSVLVTGAGGSIGSELCRQIVQFGPEKLILLDASESNLYDIQMELKHGLGYQKYATILEYVQNRRGIKRVFGHFRPDVVFHAAAYKHVPMLERNPWQAIHNNIRGSHVVMEECVENKTGYFVLVSTDKAVQPTNVMGASKRITELLVQSYIGNETRMMAVRFGNVVGSAGSVVPLFRKQIARGGPVTVTHPEVTRYFMTIPEATQLILQAGAIGEGGEVLILEMGTPVKIADMARDLIRLSGKEPDKDIKIVFTGLRAGDKLYEELITEDEEIFSTGHEKILVLKPDGSWNGHDNQEAFRHWLRQGLEELEKLADEQDAPGIKQKLKELVPEYEPWSAKD